MAVVAVALEPSKTTIHKLAVAVAVLAAMALALRALLSMGEKELKVEQGVIPMDLVPVKLEAATEGKELLALAAAAAALPLMGLQWEWGQTVAAVALLTRSGKMALLTQVAVAVLEAQRVTPQHALVEMAALVMFD
jgi:hypothetical protein